MTDEPPGDWQERRRSAAEEHLAALERRRAGEADKARVHLAEFVAAAREQGLATTRLRARAYHGRASYRTQVVGWYIRRNGSLGVGTDGQFYILSAPASLRSRFTGVDLAPTTPPLVVGAGGRDGEPIPLDELLRQRLTAGDAWPSP